MTLLGYLVAAVFLPLFPFSMAFNRLFARLGDSNRRMGLLLLWPQLGILVLMVIGERPPDWMLWWAVATAALYALRAVAVRDLAIWTGFMATSAWALLWPAAAVASLDAPGGALVLQGAGLSLPLMLVAWLIGPLESQLGAAYAGLRGGMGESLPRLAGLLTLAVLAAVGTPLVPGFFTLLSITVNALPVMPSVALAILVVWLLWAWGGTRILSGFIVGPASGEPAQDLGAAATSWLCLAFVVLVMAGIGLSGELI